MQIRTKITLQFIGIVAVILVIAMAYIHFQFKTSLQKEFYNNLESKALMMGEMIVGKTVIAKPLEGSHKDVIDGFSDIYKENISIFDTEGNRIYSFKHSLLPLPPDIISKVLETNNHKFKMGDLNAIGVKYLNQKGLTYIVVAEAAFSSTHLKRLTYILNWVFFLSVILVAFGGWFLSHQALLPLIGVMNQVDKILPTNLGRRLSTPSQKDELSRLVLTFNQMLDRIQNAFNSQKMFLSNISHELKNPLHVIISQIEIVLDKERNSEEYKEVLSSVLTDTRELNEMATKLMQLARINSDGSSVKFALCRIDEILWQSKILLIKHHPEYTIKLNIISLPEKEANLNIQGNEHLLKIALLNLMDNGCKYSPDKTVQVKITYELDLGFEITINDNGPGIAEKDLPFIKDAFYRGNRHTEVKGSGIGLALADSIFKLHSVIMSIESSSEQGTCIRLRFPFTKKVK
ncbi:sensor histidine kinase [Membranihabitans marinus]|uniref:sensor histidine kinase n=1 Tax=Membranihabitans marinus TaxID=1227546 RepID=UPI001F2674AB|nr:HAMP domain-containing sensor histidine kinase [Membranihabitans marinus]